MGVLLTGGGDGLLGETKQRGSAERYVRQTLKQLAGYKPIVPLEVLGEKAGLSVTELIKLDGNENPYGCSPRVQRSLAEYPYLHIYPDPTQSSIRKALASYVNVGEEHIVGGSGSDELIDLALRLFIDPGDGVINCEPTFGMYDFGIMLCDGEVINVPRVDSFAIDVAAVEAAIKPNAKLILVATPNNPTGNLTPRADILRLLDTGLIVLVDEAYYEFSGETVADLVPQYENLIVLRTFSKWAGLAGLRAGYGVFPPRIADLIMKIKTPYNVNIAAQIAIQESLKDVDYLMGTVKAILAERERFRHLLKEFDWIRTYPSDANFLLLALPSVEMALRVDEGLQRKGIFGRYFDKPRLEHCFRISVGKPEHTDAVIRALREIGGGNLATTKNTKYTK
ncbi:MAG: histidinol-phosphate transaminase [Chloroflexi bacterium]|nr:histidinol-phosphate transaminase [Chloroflexota bacterium]